MSIAECYVRRRKHNMRFALAQRQRQEAKYARSTSCRKYSSGRRRQNDGARLREVHP